MASSSSTPSSKTKDLGHVCGVCPGTLQRWGRGETGGVRAEARAFSPAACRVGELGVERTWLLRLVVFGSLTHTSECFRALVFCIFKLEPSPRSLPTRDFCSAHAWLHVGPGLGILPSSWEKGILMASLGLCVFPSQNDKSSTPGLKSNTPTPRNDAPTPGTSTTPGLRSMPGKPPGMDPIGIMGRHHWGPG